MSRWTRGRLARSSVAYRTAAGRSRSSAATAAAATAAPDVEWTASAVSQACGRPATDVDHILPRVRGGSDVEANLQSLCAAHHHVKTAQLDRT
jgi:5-methylcytosine-specific restriction endonuclease McrA